MNTTFYIYILTNWKKTVLYIGVTNDLTRRLREHISGAIPGFSHKYKCKDLVYYEQFDYINNAIQREKEIKSGGQHQGCYHKQFCLSI